MAQYFEYDPTQKEATREFTYYFGSVPFLFRSDTGLFSTGHMDEATDLLLHQIPPFSGSLLDLGCGWGALGVVLGKINTTCSVTMVDVNPKALAYAKDNCLHNGVTATHILSDGFAQLTDTFDVIALNPPIHAGKEVVFHLYEGAAAHLNDCGAFYVVIQKKHGAVSSIKKLTELFGQCEPIYQKKGIYVLRCTK